jgi:bifunctional enzyme CysN/CysC
LTSAVGRLGDLLAAQAQETKPTLRFLTCGSESDGKSTLVGRLLLDTHARVEQPSGELKKDSKKHVTTIDVAYRFFATEKRKFIVADTPGRESYTRNMATGASNSELAVILVDARKGILAQTRRHTRIVSLFGIKHVVLAINKIDLVDDSEGAYGTVVHEFEAFAKALGFATSVPIPMSARFGDNVRARSNKTPWYSGPSLVEHLETVKVEAAQTSERAFRMPVQWVNRPNLEFRGFSGTVSAGRLATGDPVVVAKSGRTSRVRRIVTRDGDLPEACSGEAVTLVLDDEIDVACGDILVAPAARPEVSDQFAAHLLWMAEEELLPGRLYLLKCGAKTVPAQVTSLKHRIDVDTFEHLAAKTLQLNEIGSANFALAEPIAFDPYAESRETGGFILIDRFSNHTVAAGMIDFGLRRASNVHWQALDVDRTARAEMKGQVPAVLWFTGLSGSGKSTIANLVERTLAREGRHTYLLDGDNVRHGLNRDLGFTDADRVENIRRVGEVSKLFVDAGIIVLVSFISPFRSEREMARKLIGEGQFIEVFVDTPLDVCIARDPKGLYRKAKAGELKNFTGIDSAYEAPTQAELVLKTAEREPAAVAEEVVRYLRDRGKMR